MKPIFIPLFLGAIFLFSCSQAPAPKKSADKETPIAEFDTTKKNPKVDSLPLILNQENHEAYLRQYFKDNPERKFKLTTRLGDVKVRLFEDTPLHTANFIMLIKRGYFDNTEFTRVAKNFVVQGGNNDSEQEEIKRLLIGNYLIEPEFKDEHIHKKGSLAMARRYTENPEKKSSAYNFYFVQGQTFNEPQLLAIERDNDMTIEPWKRAIYKSIGGAPHLDNEHTVFGEVYEGLEVLEKMSLVETDQSEWPLEPLVMNVEIID